MLKYIHIWICECISCGIWQIGKVSIIWSSHHNLNQCQYLLHMFSLFLYLSETETIYCSYLKLLERFHQKCLQILSTKWQSLMPDIEVLNRADCMCIKVMDICNQMCQAEHGWQESFKDFFMANCKWEYPQH